MKLKKLTLITLLVSLFQIMNAQNEAKTNTFVLGGSMNFQIQNNTITSSRLMISSGIVGISSISTNDTKNVTFSFSPYFGKEIDKNWLLGLHLDYRIGKSKAEDILFFGQSTAVDFERNSNQIGIGVFARYVLNPEKKFNFYLQPYAEYNFLNEEERQDSDITQEEKANSIEVGIGAGVLYNINDKWRATLQLGGLNYINGNWEIVDTDIENDFSSFKTNFNLSSILFGVEIKL